jgi:hypothetical protein
VEDAVAAVFPDAATAKSAGGSPEKNKVDAIARMKALGVKFMTTQKYKPFTRKKVAQRVVPTIFPKRRELNNA